MLQPCYRLDINESNLTQNDGNVSYIGGIPQLPLSVNVPHCKECGAEQTFFYQVAFPKDHYWSGLSMALFACTSCANEELLIPKMLSSKLKGADIPKGFLESYQNNFRIIVFNTSEGVLKTEYKEKVKYKSINLVKTEETDINQNKIGGYPNWLLDDESPESYNQSTPMFFLMQILEGFTFEKLPDTAPQIELGLSGEAVVSTFPYYQLFLGNNIYFFGTIDKANPQVYILTQI